MAQDHSHHNHDHSITMKDVNTAFIVGIVLNLLFVVIEVGMGLSINSLSLLSDAGHNLADVGALALSLLAFKLLKVKSNKNYTYGLKKTSILVALLNAIILLLSIGAIIYEAIIRFANPEPIPGKTIAIIAAIGIAINLGTGLMFLSNKEKDINVKSAYLHLMSDAFVSFGIVVGGIIMVFTNWFWIDSALSLIIAIVILISTWKLLKQSMRLSLDGVPENIEVASIELEAMKITGVKGMHHIHVWALSTLENALTAHVVLASHVTSAEAQDIKHNLKHRLEHLNIQHVTLETENEGETCYNEVC
ncbi:MAG: cation transporter [Sphingobacteriales bacterium]|nr:cation transporter [Sphingobacteriales bacterium]